MIALASLVLLQVAAHELPPADWSRLPTLAAAAPVPQEARLSAFVATEVRAGRCAAATATAEGQRLTVEMAVLVSPAGQVRRIVPRAIGCAAVEQYATGLATRLIRRAPSTPAGGWFRTALDFAW